MMYTVLGELATGYRSLHKSCATYGTLRALLEGELCKKPVICFS